MSSNVVLTIHLLLQKMVKKVEVICLDNSDEDMLRLSDTSVFIKPNTSVIDLLDSSDEDCQVVILSETKPKDAAGSKGIDPDNSDEELLQLRRITKQSKAVEPDHHRADRINRREGVDVILPEITAESTLSKSRKGDNKNNNWNFSAPELSSIRSKVDRLRSQLLNVNENAINRSFNLNYEVDADKEWVDIDNCSVSNSQNPTINLGSQASSNSQHSLVYNFERADLEVKNRVNFESEMYVGERNETRGASQIACDITGFVDPPRLQSELPRADSEAPSQLEGNAIGVASCRQSSFDLKAVKEANLKKKVEESVSELTVELSKPFGTLIGAEQDFCDRINELNSQFIVTETLEPQVRWIRNTTYRFDDLEGLWVPCESRRYYEPFVLLLRSAEEFATLIMKKALIKICRIDSQRYPDSNIIYAIFDVKQYHRKRTASINRETDGQLRTMLLPESKPLKSKASEYFKDGPDDKCFTTALLELMVESRGKCKVFTIDKKDIGMWIAIFTRQIGKRPREL